MKACWGAIAMQLAGIVDDPVVEAHDACAEEVVPGVELELVAGLSFVAVGTCVYPPSKIPCITNLVPPSPFLVFPTWRRKSNVVRIFGVVVLLVWELELVTPVTFNSQRTAQPPV